MHHDPRLNDTKSPTVVLMPEGLVPQNCILSGQLQSGSSAHKNSAATSAPQGSERLTKMSNGSHQSPLPATAAAMTTSVQEADDGFFSTLQSKILQPTSVVTGFLSILGSSNVICNILTPPKATSKTSRASAPVPKTLRNSVCCRLMFGLSCLDVLFGFGNVASGSWSIPSEINFVHNPRGSWASSATGGFFAHFMLATTLC